MLALRRILLEDLAMEMPPQPDTIRYIDVLDPLDRDAYLRQIAITEEIAEEADETDELPSKPLEALDEMLGAGGEEELAVYTGWAYVLDDEGELSDEPVMLVDAPLTFGGASYVDVDGVWRVMYELRDDAAEQQVQYAAPFEAMWRLEVLEGERPEARLTEIIDRHIAMSRELVHSADFVAASSAEQEALLVSAAKACHQELMECIGDRDVTIDCSRYFVLFDNKTGERSHPLAVDIADYQNTNALQVQGNLAAVVYMKAPQSSQLKTHVRYNDVPALAIRNQPGGYTTYIPLDKLLTTANEC